MVASVAGSTGGAGAAADDFPAQGYWLVDTAGDVHAFGGAEYHGSVAQLHRDGVVATTAPEVALAGTPSGKGYWILDAVGGVFSFGDAGFHGSIPPLQASGQLLGTPVLLGMAPTPSGHGYWILDAFGGVFSFGDAGFHGSMPGLVASGVVAASPQPVPVVGLAPTPSGHGYWLLDAFGGVFSFGDAGFHGSIPARTGTTASRLVAAGVPGGSVMMPGLRRLAVGKRIALTFDDGPDVLRTPVILDVLARERVPATFFVMGGHAARLPGLVQRMAREGHSVQNHTWSHADLSSGSESLLQGQVDNTNSLLTSLTGERPTCVRPPGGASSATLVQRLHARGLHTAMWTVDPFDWRGITAGEIVGRVVDEAHPDAVVVLHDRTNIVEALPALVRELRARGFTFSTVCDRWGFLPPERL